MSAHVSIFMLDAMVFLAHAGFLLGLRTSYGGYFYGAVLVRILGSFCSSSGIMIFGIYIPYDFPRCTSLAFMQSFCVLLLHCNTGYYVLSYLYAA